MFFFLRAMRLGHKHASLEEKLANATSHRERMHLVAELKLVEYDMEQLFA